MSVFEFTSLIGAGAFAAGFLGALTGLGGGVVIVPLLTLLFHVDIRYAIGASLVSVIATSSGAAAAYVKEGYSNMRVGMFLEMATTLGALSARCWLRCCLGGDRRPSSAWCCSGPPMLRASSRNRARTQPPDRLANLLRLDSTYPTPQGKQSYRVLRFRSGSG